jgi:hypothetical protein
MPSSGEIPDAILLERVTIRFGCQRAEDQLSRRV